MTLPPECPIEVRFSFSKSLWFDMIFVAGRQGRVVETSELWNIGDLFKWLEAISRGESHVEMEIDREGLMDTVEALYIDENRVHLIIRDKFEGDIPFLEAVVSRKKLVWEIYYELREFSQKIGYHYDPEKRAIDPEWAHLPGVEEWLDWEKYTNPYSMKDDVTGLERA